MSARYVKTMGWVLLTLLAVSCRSAATATLPSATATPLSLTSTPIPPTQTPTSPTATSTLVHPTATITKSAFSATPIAESTFDGVRVTYVFNSGFLITVGDQRILIDAIQEGNPTGLLRPILESQPPFDGVDLVLATHEHSDHFSPSLVRQYMLANANTIFVSTQSAVDILLAMGNEFQERAIPVKINKGESKHIEVNGIALQAFHLSHGIPRFLNLGFVITVGGVTFFHTGDIDTESVDVSDLQSYGLPEMQIDIAFVPYFFFTEAGYYSYMRDGIQARYLIPIHFYGRLSPLAGFEDTFPNFHIFSESYESWVYPNPEE